MKNKKHLLGDILLVLCIIVFLGSGGVLAAKMIGQKKNDGRLEDLSGLVNEELGEMEAAETEAEGSGLSAEEAEAAAIRAVREARVKAYSKVKEENSDLVGWIRIEGTKIDYPVLQTPDNPNFYLKHDFDKKQSSYGAPYVAEECDLSEDCKNIIIYGHHMKNGSMFAGLEDYLSPEFRDVHPVVEFDTLEDYGDYEVMAIFTMSAADQNHPLYEWITGGTQEAFEEYVSYVKEHSVYKMGTDTGIDAAWGDHLLTLITCEYTHKDGRLIVVAKKIEE